MPLLRESLCLLRYFLKWRAPCEISNGVTSCVMSKMRPPRRYTFHHPATKAYRIIAVSKIRHENHRPERSLGDHMK